MLWYTNGSHKVFVDEVFEERGVTDVRRIKRGKSSSLGMPKAPQVNISNDTQASKLGDAPVGIPSFFFNKYRYTSVFVLFTWFVSFVFFFLRTMLVWDSPSLIYRMFHVLHLYLLSMTLYNALCASLKSFEYGFIECFVCFTYIFWAWILVSLY